MSGVINTPENNSLIAGLGNLALTPVSLRRIFLLLTRLHFSDSKHYGDKAEPLKDFIWSADDKVRKLFIDYDYHYQPTHLEQRPAVFVGVDDLIFTRQVLDNQRENTEDRSGTNFTYKAETSIILRHISLTPDEALTLGELSVDFFAGVRKMLMETMRLQHFDVTALKSTRPFLRTEVQSDQQFSCDLIMRISFLYDWVTFRESHRIKTVSFKEAVVAYALPTNNDTAPKPQEMQQ